MATGRKGCSRMDIAERLGRIELLILDVDGVLTTGEVVFNGRGDEIKAFNARDGFGMRLLQAAGMQIAIATGRKSEALARRCRELDIDLVFDGLRDKAAVIGPLAARTAVDPERMAFMGDDLPDIALMKRVGLAIAVADAHPLVRQEAHLTTRARGGRGAVREVCERLLEARGKWQQAVERFVR